MNHITAPIFQALFNSETPRIILKADAPDFTILDYNQSYQRLAGIHENFKYKTVWSLYEPALAAGNGIERLRLGLEAAITGSTSIQIDELRYDVQTESEEMQIRWWQLEILPVKNDAGEIAYLMMTSYDVTELQHARFNSQELSDELAASNEELSAANEELNSTIEALELSRKELYLLNEELELRIEERVHELAEAASSLRSLVMTAHYPLMILRGREWIIEIANQPLVNLWDKTIEEVTGHRLMEILPEIEDQPFPGFLCQVYDTGVGYGQEEQIFHYNSPSGPATKYVSFYYDPMWDAGGEVCGIIVAAEDITSKVLQRIQLEESLMKEQALTEASSALNEELTATVEELSAANEELSLVQERLGLKNAELSDSEGRFKALIRQAPVGICIINAEDLMIPEVNDAYLELVGKTRLELENRTIWEAVSEAAESYAPVMNQVINTGVPFIANEHEVTLLRYGKPEQVFLDFVYEPVFGAKGKVTMIMVVVIDVTEKVMARKSIENVEERIRLAVDSAQIGTFEHNYLTDAFIASERVEEIFGVQRPKNRLDLIARFHPEDRYLSDQAHQQGAKTGKLFYETRVILPGEKVRWVRIQGKVIFLQDGTPERILGTILDITDYKHLQQQKDDFISIASHELKTPITSLKAALQLLQRTKEKPNPTLLPKLIDQASRSMVKISALVDDLLNVSRMSAESIELNKSEFVLSRLVKDCSRTILENNLGKLLITGELEISVFADEHRIDQVLTNFLSNSVKYAPSSEKIIVNIKQLGQMIKVSVIDEGQGIPEEILPHVFERYYRADSSGKTVSGLGLGLFISADIIRRHGGEIGVDSEVGRGSTFWFSLPLSD